MQSGAINVEYSIVKRSPPRTDVLNLVTIRRRTVNRNFTVTGAIDALTAERVDLAEAKSRGLVDAGHYVNRLTGCRLPLDEAVDDGWVLAKFDPTSAPPEFDVRTYVVFAVVDQLAGGTTVPLRQAIRHGLIDRQTGNYVDNVTGRKVFVSDAIKRGLIKAEPVSDLVSLALSLESNAIIRTSSLHDASSCFV